MLNFLESMSLCQLFLASANVLVNGNILNALAVITDNMMMMFTGLLKAFQAISKINGGQNISIGQCLKLSVDRSFMQRGELLLQAG